MFQSSFSYRSVNGHQTQNGLIDEDKHCSHDERDEQSDRKERRVIYSERGRERERTIREALQADRFAHLRARSDEECCCTIVEDHVGKNRILTGQLS